MAFNLRLFGVKVRLTRHQVHCPTTQLASDTWKILGRSQQLASFSCWNQRHPPRDLWERPVTESTQTGQGRQLLSAVETAYYGRLLWPLVLAPRSNKAIWQVRQQLSVEDELIVYWPYHPLCIGKCYHNFMRLTKEPHVPSNEHTWQFIGQE